MRNNNYENYKHYKNLDDKILLNLSFISGDELHSMWDCDEEKILLPYLVSIGDKPVASIVLGKSNSKKCINHNILIPTNCNSLIVKNRWNIYILLIFIKELVKTKEELDKTKKVLISLANETLPFTQIGLLYGYNN